MSYIKIHQDRISDREAAKALCPFGAIAENAAGELEIGAGCRMCRLCIRKGGDAFEFVDDAAPGVDKSKWRGVAVVGEIGPDGRLHPVGLELLGKARELAGKLGVKVGAVLMGDGVEPLAQRLVEGGADVVHLVDDPALKVYRNKAYRHAMVELDQ